MAIALRITSCNVQVSSPKSVRLAVGNRGLFVVCAVGKMAIKAKQETRVDILKKRNRSYCLRPVGHFHNLSFFLVSLGILQCHWEILRSAVLTNGKPRCNRRPLQTVCRLHVT